MYPISGLSKETGSDFLGQEKIQKSWRQRAYTPNSGRGKASVLQMDAFIQCFSYRIFPNLLMSGPFPRSTFELNSLLMLTHRHE